MASLRLLLQLAWIRKGKRFRIALSRMFLFPFRRLGSPMGLVRLHVRHCAGISCQMGDRMDDALVDEMEVCMGGSLLRLRRCKRLLRRQENFLEERRASTDWGWRAMQVREFWRAKVATEEPQHHGQILTNLLLQLDISPRGSVLSRWYNQLSFINLVLNIH